MPEHLQSRKDQHLDLCLEAPVSFREKSTLLEEVSLVHEALPDLALAEVDCSCELLGHRLAAPLIIAAMTGGTERAALINRDLAAVAQELGLGLGLGSQRRQLVSGSTLGFEVRDVAPDVLLLGNIGLTQARDAAPAALEHMVRAVGCDALCVHLNPAMELVQPEGDVDFREGTATLRRLAQLLAVPVVLKETGCGISREVALRAREAGLRTVDVSGAGGTSWIGVEALRAEGAAARLGEAFWDWGIPTAASVAQCDGLGLSVIATGGIQGGLDLLRALTLGAAAGGMARPVLQAWGAGGREAVRALLREVIDTLRVGMLLTGSRDLGALRARTLVLGPRLLAWVPAEAPLRARLLA
ncbi:MAG: type 2 isopentenyl-diphosphate Delta-isomerase [Pseudomonadota bacterium]